MAFKSSEPKELQVIKSMSRSQASPENHAPNLNGHAGSHNFPMFLPSPMICRSSHVGRGALEERRAMVPTGAKREAGADCCIKNLLEPGDAGDSDSGAKCHNMPGPRQGCLCISVLPWKCETVTGCARACSVAFHFLVMLHGHCGILLLGLSPLVLGNHFGTVVHSTPCKYKPGHEIGPLQP